jgi:hypothetical protein
VVFIRLLVLEYLVVSSVPGKFQCNTCGREYRHQPSLWKHVRYECQKEPTFGCSFCPYKAKTKGNLQIHINGVHLKLKRTKKSGQP